MKTSTLKIISLLFLILLGFWAYNNYYKKAPPSENFADQFKLLQIEEKANSFTLKRGEENLTLKRESGLWQVESHQADEKKINQLFETLRELTISGPVSRNPANHQKFSVDEQKGIFTTFKDDDQEIITFIIGKPGSTGSTNYLRKTDQDEVFSANASLSSQFSLQVDDWRDKTILRVDRQPVKKITFAYPQEEFSLQLQEDGSWLAKNKQEKKVEDEVITSFFTALNPLEATGFVEDEEEVKDFNQAKSLETIRLFNQDDQIIHELTLLEKENLSWVKTKDKETIYTLSQTLLSDVLLKSEDIF